MDISVIIPTVMTPTEFQPQLNRLLQLIPQNIATEILVIHNGYSASENAELSSVDQRANSEKPVSIQRLFLKNRNANQARNFGIKHCKSEKILFLDDDVLPCDSTIFLRVFDITLEQGIEGGLYQPSPTMKFIDLAYVIIANQWIYSGQLLNKNFHLVGGFMWGHIDHFRWNDGFDNDIAFGGTETEFLLRFATHNKFPVTLVESQMAFHNSQISVRQLVRKATKQAQTHRKYFAALQLPLVELHRLFDWNQIPFLKKWILKSYMSIYQHAFEKEFRS